MIYIDHRWSMIDHRPSMIFHRCSMIDGRSDDWLSMIDHRSSVADERSSTIDHRWWFIDHRSSIINDRWSMIDSRSSIIDGRWWIIDHRSSIIWTMKKDTRAPLGVPFGGCHVASKTSLWLWPRLFGSPSGPYDLEISPPVDFDLALCSISVRASPEGGHDDLSLKYGLMSEKHLGKRYQKFI